jgi:hypothetical protein
MHCKLIFWPIFIHWSSMLVVPVGVGTFWQMISQWLQLTLYLRTVEMGPQISVGQGPNLTWRSFSYPYTWVRNEPRHEEWRYISTHFWTWNWMNVVFIFMPSASLLSGKRPRDHWIGGWMGPRVDLEAVEKSKTSCSWHATFLHI